MTQETELYQGGMEPKIAESFIQWRLKLGNYPCGGFWVKFPSWAEMRMRKWAA